MDQERTKPKVLLLRKTAAGESSAGWEACRNALNALAEHEEREEQAVMSLDSLGRLSGEFDYIFLDQSLMDWSANREMQLPNLILVFSESIPWNHPGTVDRQPLMAKHPTLVLEQINAADLTRLLHLFFAPKRLAGVTPMLEKHSLVLAEKIQSLASLGSLLDKLSIHLARIEEFSLKDRLPDLRQVLSGLIASAFQIAEKAATPYPTVDFQVGVNQGKVVLNLRFAHGAMVPSEIPQLAMSGGDLFWQQVWQLSDGLLLTQHIAQGELEVMALFHRPQRAGPMALRSLLSKQSSASAKKENLLLPPPQYDFQVISDIRLKDSEQVQLVLASESSEIDLGGLPDPVVKKLKEQEEELGYLRAQLEKGKIVIRETNTALNAANQEIGQKRTEILRLMKKSETLEQTLAKEKSGSDKKQSVSAAISAAQQGPSKEAVTIATMKEAIQKLEGTLRAADNEKAQILEKNANDLKKLTLFEQKYSAMHKELTFRDKELRELKTAMIKLKKEAPAEQKTANAAANPANDKSSAKLKDAEAKEVALRQELKKLSFKLENHEKNVKVIQTEAAEKTKLMEQKLQAAKAKEVELLKKIDDLTMALKKASKAA